MLADGLLGVLTPDQQQQMLQQNGPLLGGQPAPAQMQQPISAAQQPMAPQAPQAPQSPGLLPNMTPGYAGAIANGMNTAMANMPHTAAQGQAASPGLTSQGVMRAMGGGMGGGINPAAQMAAHAQQTAGQPAMPSSGPAGGVPQQPIQPTPQLATSTSTPGGPANSFRPQAVTGLPTGVNNATTALTGLPIPNGVFPGLNNAVNRMTSGISPSGIFANGNAGALLL